MKSGLQKGNLIQKLLGRRITRLSQVVGEMIWEKRGDVNVFGGPVTNGFVPLSEAKKASFSPVKPGEYFGPGDANNAYVTEWDRRWFKVVIPAAKKAERGRRVLFWDCRGESTVYVDGVPWAGLDVMHPYCVLPDERRELWIDCGCYQTAIWGPGKTPDEHGLRFDGAWIACRNELAWDVHWDLKTLVELLTSKFEEEDLPFPGAARYYPDWEEVHPMARKLVRRLNDCCDAYDDDGLAAMSRTLKKIYRDFPAESWQLKATCCGHGHLDLVWFWPESVGERKAVHTTATTMRLIERYPEFKAMLTQPAMYKAIERVEPDLYQQMLERIKSGSLEATGGMWVEADNILPCGESLARCFSLGQRFFASVRGGKISTNLWLPDVFGYAACLPQLMRLSGIESFYTTKLGWSVVTRFPYDSMIWRGDDGSEVLCHMSGLGINCTPGWFMKFARKFRQIDVHDEMIRPVGAGDGGGGPDEGDCERFRRLKNLTQVPKVQWGSVEGFFDRMGKIKDDLPVYQGELYMEGHRGVFTTQSDFKIAYRRAEVALRTHEAVRVIRGGGPVESRLWERICFAQFHDAIPGSSVAAVYAEMTPQMREVANTALDRSAKELKGRSRNKALAAFNPLPFKRNAIVELPKAALGRGARGVDVGGRLFPIQKVTGADHVLAPIEVDGLAAATIKPVAKTPKKSSSWNVTNKRLDNGRVRVEFDATGRLRLMSVDGETLELTEPAGFTLHVDDPAYHDAWDIDQYSLANGKPAFKSMKLTVKEKGPVRAILEGEAAIGESSRLTVRYVLEADSPWLKIETDVDWHESHVLLKYNVPTGYAGRHARYGAPFGSALRQQCPGRLDVESMWEVPGSRWAAALRDDGAGMAVIGEARYGFSCRDGLLTVSLLRSPKRPDATADMGSRSIKFAVGTHRVETEGIRLNTSAAADSLYDRPLVFSGSAVVSPLTLEDMGTLVPAWCFPNEESQGWSLRLHETMGAAGRATLRVTDPKLTIDYVDNLERSTGKPKRLGPGRHAIDYTPYQIVTIRARA